MSAYPGYAKKAVKEIGEIRVIWEAMTVPNFPSTKESSSNWKFNRLILYHWGLSF